MIRLAYLYKTIQRCDRAQQRIQKQRAKLHQQEQRLIARRAQARAALAALVPESEAA